MIKVSDITEVSVKTDIIEKYKNIKPDKEMTAQEADDFWNSEFAKVQEEVDATLYDGILSEVFNRCEDDININFDVDDKLMSILDKFKSEDWDVMNEEQQLSVLTELTQEVGEKLGLDKIPTISVFEDTSGVYGRYDPVNNVVNLNKNYFNDSSEVVNTLTHELRHAFQILRAERLETWEDVLYRVNLDNYISPVHLPGGGWLFFTDYMDQYMEVDARKFAKLFAEVMEYERGY
ncbi:MAG: hypothetical protein HFH87_08780 [Lachnospiraceae bacterium]|nr:hypothetical protein [Lachnospiraceae bacterium]